MSRYITPRFAFAFLATAFLALAPAAHADRRYFVDTYTPFLGPRGDFEFELWTTAFPGQGDVPNTAWQNRGEFEYGITNRLTGSFYMNFVQQDGQAQKFDGPSIELLYNLAERGRIPLDPTAYVEVRENGDELELEPKLIVGHRAGGWVSALNAIGEFEWQHVSNAPPPEKAFELAGGVTREFGTPLSIGVEARWLRGFPPQGEAPSALFAGPTINLQTEKLQLAFGWHPQLWGSPETGANLNLSDFPRSEFRLVLGMDL